MNVVITNRQRTRKVNSRMLRKITDELLADLEVEKADLGINLVAAPAMTTLNETFLRHEGTTDVITFDYSVQFTGARAARPRGAKTRTRGRAARAPLIGEIFICVDEAVAQAKKFKTTWQSEIVRYVIHGILHLLGHDDLRAADRRRMKREENRLLRRFSRRFSLAQPARAVKLSA
jgi:probable rRNA maturation factor